MHVVDVAGVISRPGNRKREAGGSELRVNRRLLLEHQDCCRHRGSPVHPPRLGLAVSGRV